MRETFVLLHGGGHGGWCYKLLATELRRRGHEVYTPTLTGFGERSHLPAAESMETHILDVANIITYEDLNDVVLVGHSLGGFTIPFVAHRVAERIKRVVWLAALVHTDGERVCDRDVGRDSPTLGKSFALREAGDEAAAKEQLLDAFLDDATPELRSWVAERLGGHSAVLRATPSQLSAFLDLGMPTGYVLATRDKALPPWLGREFASRLPGCRYVEIDADHDLMLSAPIDTADCLEAMALP